MKNITKKIGLGLMVATFLVALGATKIGSSKIPGIRLMIDPPGFITLIK